MKPQRQTIMGDGGDCFRACVASIFDLRTVDVPHFMEGKKAGDIWTQEQWDSVQKWAEDSGHRAVWIDPEDAADAPFVKMLIDSGLHYVSTGDTAWGPHCCVMKGGRFVWNPLGDWHPMTNEPFLYVVFEPINDAPIHETIPEVVLTKGADNE